MSQLKTNNFTGVWTLFLREVYRFLQMPGQTIVPPLLSSLLYILVFGRLIGTRVGEIIPGVGYIDFMIPGILMMNVVGGAFMSTSFGIYISKMQNAIQEVLVAPLSYVEMGLGYVAAGALRGVLTGLGVYLVAIFFTDASIAHFWSFLFFLFITSALFSALGAIVGLWANSFEHINIPNTFILMPLSFLGGVFHSVQLLPETYATLTKLNPIFYMVNGIRGSMIGVSDTPPLQAATIVVILTVAAFVGCVYLFRSGYRLRV